LTGWRGHSEKRGSVAASVPASPSCPEDPAHLAALALRDAELALRLRVFMGMGWAPWEGHPCDSTAIVRPFSDIKHLINIPYT